MFKESDCMEDQLEMPSVLTAEYRPIKRRMVDGRSIIFDRRLTAISCFEVLEGTRSFAFLAVSENNKTVRVIYAPSKSSSDVGHRGILELASENGFIDKTQNLLGGGIFYISDSNTLRYGRDSDNFGEVKNPKNLLEVDEVLINSIGVLLKSEYGFIESYRKY
jgi:hypothetical protein